MLWLTEAQLSAGVTGGAKQLSELKYSDRNEITTETKKMSERVNRATLTKRVIIT
jgi:hypothetical protein